jgi:hypothetical protein
MQQPENNAGSRPSEAGWRSIDLNTPRALAIARVIIPICFGLYSLWLGADTNWDSRNYHLYNPFAWLYGKLQVDLAPAGMQSYFNPMLDVGFYLATTHLPSRVVGFGMGVLHGLSFVLILGIVQRALPALPDGDRFRVPLLLASAGCLTANFLSGVGNSMGDDTTALSSLASLLVLLIHWDRLGQWSIRSVAFVGAAGMLVGMGAGLKLTNAVFAVALCASLLIYPDRLIVRLRIAVLFGIGVLAGFAITGGYWMFHMWKLFGNPLFPQFSSLFPNALAAPVGVADIRWGPKSWLETVFWPFIFAANSRRVGEIPIRQIIWPIAYVLFWIWFACGIAQWWTGRRVSRTDSRALFCVLLVATAYVIWMAVFSIYRYIVAAEVLTPLVVWIMLEQLLPYRRARRVAGGLILLATAVVVTGGAPTWGHADYADPLYHAEVPALPEPERATVVIATTSSRAWAWLATQFSPQVAFMQVDSTFPGTQAFRDRMLDTAKKRGGALYAIVDGAYNWRIDNVARVSNIVDNLALTRSERGCDTLQWAITRLRLHAAVTPSGTADKRCALGLRADDVRDTVKENRVDAQAAVPMFERNGFSLDKESCVPYRAGIGNGVDVYQWCRLSVRVAK